MATHPGVLAAIDAAFGAIAKPEHFTNYTHCEECAEHDTLLASRDRSTLRVQDVGNPGWDPLCFSSPEGIAYYMPSLARFALAPPTYSHGWYGDQLLFHLFSGAAANAFFNFCNAAQRRAIASLLEHLVETRTTLVERVSSEDEMLRAHQFWSSGA